MSLSIIQPFHKELEKIIYYKENEKIINSYKFADYTEQIINLLKTVCIFSVESMQVINEMAEL
jgi:hypothetical protein